MSNYEKEVKDAWNRWENGEIMRAPCYNCPERKEGCHGKCDKYAAYKKEKEAEYERRKRRTVSY